MYVFVATCICVIAPFVVSVIMNAIAGKIKHRCVSCKLFHFCILFYLQIWAPIVPKLLAFLRQNGLGISAILRGINSRHLLLRVLNKTDINLILIRKIFSPIFFSRNKQVSKKKVPSCTFICNSCCILNSRVDYQISLIKC